jgi:tetratricopeptide (TPR) repeat protein
VYFLSSEVDFAFGEGEKAITSLTRYVEQFPNNPNALYRRAQLYGNMWKWQSAISDLEKLRASSPDALAYSPRLLLALAYDLVERSDLALSELKTLYEQHPDNERICREFLNYYLKHERYAETLTLATALVNRQPDYELWYRFQGQAAMKLEDGAKALESFSKAVELSNLEWRNVSALLEAYSYFKNFEPGIRFYEDQVPEDKRVPPLICRYADLLAGAGRQEEAIAAYREALSSPGAYGDELFVQEVAAHTWQHLGKRPALEMFKVEPAEERLKRPNSHLVASLLYYADYRTESLAALDALLATAGSDEERAGLLARKAVLLEAEKEHEAARGVYEEAVKLNPKNFVALNNLAYLLSDKLGKPTDAVPYAERAAEISGQPQVIDTLGWCRVQTGDASAIRQAIGDFSKALLLDPQFVPGHYHRAEAYRRDGRLDEAISGYEAALKLIAQTTNPEYLAFKEPAEKGLEKARAGDKSP